jgi:hypothetical protein
VCIITALLLFHSLQAQHHSGQPVPQVSLHLNGKYSLAQLTADTYRQTGIGFSYDAKKISNQPPLQFANKSYTLQQVLEQIQHTTGLQYAVYTGHIILNNPAKPQKPIPKKQAPVIPRKKDTTAVPRFITLPANYAQVILPGTADDTRDTHQSILQQQRSLPAAKALPAATAQPPVAAPPAAPATPPSTPAVEPSAAKERNLSAAYLQAGAFATDAMYANAGIEAGLSWLHLLASVGRNNRVTEWRLGIGTLVKRTRRSDFQLNASIGFMQKGYEADSFTYKRIITAKGILPAVHLEWRYFFNNRLSAKLALGHNVLFTSYNINGQKSVLPIDIRNTADETFRLVHPWKLLSNSFTPEKATNIKQWMGGAVGIYYNLNFFKRQ